MFFCRKITSRIIGNMIIYRWTRRDLGGNCRNRIPGNFWNAFFYNASMRNMNHLFLICSIGISKGTDLIWRTDLEKKTFCLFYMLLYFFCLILHFDVFMEFWGSKLSRILFYWKFKPNSFKKKQYILKMKYHKQIYI